MSVDNPYYFYTENNSPKTPDSSTSKGFSFFKRRSSSKGSSQSNLSTTNKATPPPTPTRQINSATLCADATVFLGSPRCSLGSYSGCEQQSLSNQNGNSLNSIYRRPVGFFGMNRERLGSFNESISYNTENDEVFLNTITRSNTSRTLPTPTHGNRRHSFGNLINRGGDRQRCSSFSDEVPKMIAPKPPIVSPNKYRSRRKDNCSSDSCNMDDILIITAKHSEKAFSWASFLKTRFDKITKQRDRKPFNFLHIKIDDIQFSPELAQKCKSTALQIAILCPAMLALPHQYLMNQFTAVLNLDKILAIVLDVTEEKLLEIHKTAFPSFRKWKRCIVRENDQSAVGNILGIATDILGRALCQRPPCPDSTNGMNVKVVPSNSCSTEEFTVVPRKVKIGQNKVLALLNSPLAKDDWIKITIEKAGELIEIKSYKQRNPFTIQFNIPETCMEISSMVEIRIEKNDKSLGSRPIKCESRLRELEQLLRSQDSPLEFMCQSLGIGSSQRDALDLHLLQCFLKNMPSNFHLLAGTSEKQNPLMSSKDSNSEEYPTLLHFAAKWGLERLCMQLVECPGGDFACDMKNSFGKTPADIAESGNFQKLSNSLKHFTQMHEFATLYHYFKGISDSSNNTKVIIHAESSNSLSKTNKFPVGGGSTNSLKPSAHNAPEYMEMSSSSESEINSKSASADRTVAVENLNYINIESIEDCNNLQTLNNDDDEFRKKPEHNKKRNEDLEVLTTELKINEPPYYQSNGKNKSLSSSRAGSADQFSQECSNLLDNCSVSSQSDYVIQPSNVPVELNGDYLMQPSNRPVQELSSGNCSTYMNDSLDESLHLKLNFEKKKPVNLNGTLKRTNSDASSTKGNADDELAEIMYDFKNNVLSIREVEQLVDKWKNRNDVKQSFKEKQEQIEKLRDEYEKIQDQMKETFKRPTPFERIRKIFSRNKTANKIALENQNDDDPKSPNRTCNAAAGQRPISTLSLHSVSSSSSSSGRMSTGSACSGTSFGDSGTHSDHEDRRHGYPTSCRVGSPGSLMENYLVPPNPRPVLSSPLGLGEDKDRLVFTTNHHRVTTPTSPNANNEPDHYIMFPSNIPVFQEHQCGLNTIIETKETPNDLTGCGLTPIKIQNTNDKNIIYGKLRRNRPKEFCSSFKPQFAQGATATATAATVPVECKKEMSDVYQNMNGRVIEQKGIKPKNFMSDNDDELNLSRQSSCDNNASFDSPHDDDDEHSYINI